MKVLVTGANGMLGTDVCAELARRGHDVYKTGRRDIVEENYFKTDLTSKADVDVLFEYIHPDAVIHCAAWTDVDRAEDPENFGEVMATNYTATRYVAEACKVFDSKIVYISSDYVFSGIGTTPWKADGTRCRPINVYGKSKLDGEHAVSFSMYKYFIVRLSWVFGKNGKNFVKTMLNLADKKELNVVNDQIGTPTYTVDAARILCDMVETEKYGTYNVTNSGGYVSWYDFAVEIFKQAGKDVTVHPIPSCAYKTPAKRPKNSRLDKSKLKKNEFEELPDWRDALSRYLGEYK